MWFKAETQGEIQKQGGKTKKPVWGREFHPRHHIHIHQNV